MDLQPASVRPSVSPAQREPLYGRLSIAHLLLVTAGTAVSLWLLQSPNRNPSALEGVLSAIFAPVYGTALAGLVLSMLAMRSSGLPATEPGHWLLIVLGGGFTGPALFIRAHAWSGQLRLGQSSTLGVLLACCVLFAAAFFILIAVLSLLVALVDLRDPLRWRVVFWLLAALLISPLFGCGCLLPFGPLLFSFLGNTAYAAVIDIQERQFRDTWHWLGVAAVFAAACHAALVILRELTGMGA